MIEFLTNIWEMISTFFTMIVSLASTVLTSIGNVFTLTTTFVSNGIKYVNALPGAVSVAVYTVLAISMAVAVLKVIKLVSPV